MRARVTTFLQLESASAIILFAMTVLAMVWANSPLADLRQAFLNTFLFTINEGLMAVFFLVVGLELKREYLYGDLAHISHFVLPLFAAVGGMLLPVGIYWAVNHSNPITLQGWATPVPTDIAFALGVISLFGRRVPITLKLFLLALAIFDDIGAICIIAVFYSHGLSYLYLALSALLVLALFICDRLAIRFITLYILLGIALWGALLYSGINPTIAGILLALTIPANKIPAESPLHRLESWLHPYVAYLIMPLFALANAGFSLYGLSWDSLTSVVVLGIILGLFVGKQAGVFGFSWILIRLGIAKLPKHTTWLAFYGATVLCGIGFTMSLFLGTLSFQNEASSYLCDVRLGVIIGSIISGIVGAVILLWSSTVD